MDDLSLHNTVTPGFLRRLMAGLYDWLLVVAIMMVLSVPLVAVDNEAVQSGNALYRLWLIVIATVFFAGFWARDGQTLGMRAWRLRLTNADGSPVKLTGALLRFSAACLSAAALGLGFLWVLIDRQKLSWHDRISGTRLHQYPKDQANSTQRTN